MYDNYILMHKDNKCGIFSINRDSGEIHQAKIVDEKYAPFLGRFDIDLFRQWWDHRAVPGSRKDMRQVVLRSGCANNRDYLARNLALSITDTYWICPVESLLRWDQVKLYGMAASSMYGPDVIPCSNSSYDPDASLGGEMEKYWDMTGDIPVLCKKAYKMYGQQSLNEQFAAWLHSRQKKHPEFVDYSVCDIAGGGKEARCKAFTSETVEFVSAFEMIRSRKTSKNVSLYDEFINICASHGLDADLIREFMDYQTLTDFVITNTDRHILNFGVLRNSDTMELIGPAPIFDSGNSMFFEEHDNKPLCADQILAGKITAVRNTEAGMLKLVKNRNAIDAAMLPSPDEVKVFYASHGIPEERALFIAECYSGKLELLERFQRGENISQYSKK